MTNQEQQQAQSARVAAQNKSNSATATSAPAPQATQVASAVKIELSDQLPIGQQQQPTAPTAQTNTHQNHNNHHNHHTHNHHNNHQAPNCCASCLMPIKDRFIFNVINQNFHQECVRCADCSVGLNEKCFTQDGKLYCRLDYWRRFGPKCSACSESIEPTEFVQKLKQDLIYHLSCFVCQDCKRHLQAGEQLHLLADNKILCKRDFLNSHQLNNHQLHHQNNSHQHHNNQTSTTSNQQANASTTTTNTTTATTTTTTTASNHHHHQRIKSATNTTNTSSTTSPNGQSDINAQSSQPNCNNIQENQSQYHHEEGLNNPGGGGANNPGAELQLASQELSKSASATTLDGGLADNEHNNNNNNSNHNEPDEDEPDELDEDGASSIGANDHLDQFQTGPPAGVPNFTTSGRAQQKGSSAGSGAGAGAGGGAGIKFDPADCNDDLVDANGKRRGPRTTIKPKQLETLRRAFESAPKPSRHIREQLAAETGLNMRVIQVWFQNRRSKERRMRNSNGSARRNFFRSSSRRLRVGPQPQQTPLASQTATPGGAPTGPQANTGGGSGPVNGASSLIAATTAGPKERASKLTKGGSQVVQGQLRNTPPLDKTGGGGAGPGGANNTKSNQSPSDFGGSSTGGSCGFTYFSDSSNQGNESSFAVMASLSAASSVANQQYSQGASSNGILQQQSPPESVGNMTPTGGAAANATNTTGLISLESPSGVGSQHSNGAGVSSGAAANGNTNNPAANQQQQQYQSSPMKNTPPPQIYQQQQQQQPQLINHQQHLIGAPQQQHHHMMQHMNNSHHQHHQQQQQHHNQHQHHHHQQQQQQQQHQHQQHHDHHHLHHAHHRLQIGGLPSHHMVQPGPGMMGPGGGMPAGLMQAHPSQAGPPSVVQW